MPIYRLLFNFQFLDQGREFELLKQTFQGFQVRTGIPASFQVEIEVRIGSDNSKLPAHPGLVSKFTDTLFGFGILQPVDIFNDFLDGAVFLNQTMGDFRPDARHARDVV